jgi:hypothetical protein
MRIRSILLAAALVSSIGGCAALSGTPQRTVYSSSLDRLLYAATDEMVSPSSKSNVALNRPIIVATSVNVDDLSESSTFGRLASQLVASRLAQLGYQVRDVTYTRVLSVTPETGEMVLSREASKLAAQYDAQAVVVGAYAIGGERIYLNLRLLDANDGRLLSTVDVSVPVNEDTQRMIVTGRNDYQRRAELGR